MEVVLPETIPAQAFDNLSGSAPEPSPLIHQESLQNNHSTDLLRDTIGAYPSSYSNQFLGALSPFLHLKTAPLDVVKTNFVIPHYFKLRHRYSTRARQPYYVVQPMFSRHLASLLREADLSRGCGSSGIVDCCSRHVCNQHNMLCCRRPYI